MTPAGRSGSTRRDLSAPDYHADHTSHDQPSLSSSIIHTLCTSSPRHAWAQHPRLNPTFARVDEDRFDIGSAAHELLLRGVNAVHVVDFDDWRKKDAQAERDQARTAGKIPMLAKHWDGVQAMVAASHEQLAAQACAPGLFVDGQPEQTIVWEDEGVLCRARLDWLHDDLSAVDDYKTTKASAEPEKWARSTMFAIGADIQVAFYLRGLEVLYPDLRGQTVWRYVVQETFPPYALSVVTLGEDVLTIARKKVGFALKVWRDCLDADVWPAYPSTPWRAELPAWEEARWLERELRDAA